VAEKSSARKADRIPPVAGGIQVNFCKNPGCANYGVPAQSTVRGGGTVQDGYELTSASAMTPLLRCRGCGEQPPIKSNTAILEERTRFLAALNPRKEPSCPDETCAHHGAPVSAGTTFYQSFGLTHSGSRRYRCKACKKTFAVGKSTTGHKAPHKNRTIFSLLMNKSPMRRISTDSRAGRTWYGYSAYNPETILKILGVFRTFYNYCLSGQDGKTPAMRLGLAKGKLALEDIIYFV